MTHKPNISKNERSAASNRWRHAANIKHGLAIIAFVACILPASNLCGQNIAIKSNLLYDLTTTLNMGGEVRVTICIPSAFPSITTPGTSEGTKRWSISCCSQNTVNGLMKYSQEVLSAFSYTMLCSILEECSPGDSTMGKCWVLRTGRLLLSMDVSVEIENMESKNAVRLTPVLTGQERKILLPPSY